MGRSRIFTVLKRSLGLAVAVSLLMMLASCGNMSDSFPDINPPTGEQITQGNVNDSSVTPEETYDFVNLTVALPYSQQTIDYLSKLYYAKLNPNVSVTTDLALLSQVEPTWYINSIQTSESGVNLATLQMWQETDSMPDLFLAEDLNGLVSGGYAAPMSDYLFDNELITLDNTYFGALSECMVDGTIYAIPHYSTSVMLAGTIDYRPSVDEALLPGYSLSDLESYLNRVDEVFNEGGEVVPFVDAYRLVPYIAYGFDGTSHSYMLNGETLVGSKINAIIEYINGLYQNNLSSGRTESGSDPRYSRVAGMWLIDSSEVTEWDAFYPGMMFYLPLPSYEETLPNPMLSLYSICMSQECDHQDFAADFAAFISLDADAQLIIRQLENQTGFIPMTRNPSLWAVIENETTWGRMLASYEQLMSSAVYCPGRNSTYSESVNSYLNSYYNDVEVGVAGDFDLSVCQEG